MTVHGIDLRSQAIADFCRKWKIRELNVFGSILRDDFRQDSDIDFLADFDEDETWDLFDEMRMHDELELLLDRKVDILSRYALDTDANRRFRHAVLSTAEQVYAL